MHFVHMHEYGTLKLDEVTLRRGMREEGKNGAREPNWGTLYTYMEIPQCTTVHLSHTNRTFFSFFKLFYYSYYMCIQGLGHFSPLPPLLPLPPTPPSPSPPHPLNTQQKLFCPYL
jgi:hypothetical protein